MSLTAVGRGPLDSVRRALGGAVERRPWSSWRWAFWRSPEGQPGWARPALLAVAAVAAVLYSWNITSSGYAYYYSDTVKAMSVSWRALLFGAADPGATVTPDKIAGAFVPQALSARLFGFHAWSVTLPQCVEGVVCVLVLYRVVRRWSGPAAGLAAAGLFACTPVAASMFGHAMEDGALVCCLVLAVDRYQYAVEHGRLRSLAFAGVWIGLGFQAKMLQAWMVLPALALGYLLCAPGRLRRRVWQTAVAGVVCLAVSLSWVVMMTVVPAADRPYVDGSTNNSAVAMVFGYNGLGRFGIHLPGAVASMGGGGGGGAPSGRMPSGTARAGDGGFPGAPGGSGGPGSSGGFGGFGGTNANGGQGGSGSAGGSDAQSGTMPGGTTGGAPGAPGGSADGPGGGGAPGGGFTGGRPGAGGLPSGGFGPGGGGATSPWLKLFEGQFAPQIGWMYPFALLSLAWGLWQRRRAGRTDRQLAGFVLWGGWLLVVGAVFSKMGSIPHTAYMATLAPPLAALAGTGAVLFVRRFRQPGAGAWMLPVAFAAEAAWSWHLSETDPAFLPWLRWLMLAASGAGTLLTAAVLIRRHLAPAAHPATDPAADSPAPRRGLGARLGARLALVGVLAGLAGAVVAPAAWSASVLDTRYAGSAFDASAGPGARSGPGGDVTTTLTADQRALYAYVKSRQGSARYLLAGDGWAQVSPYLLATGARVLPMGGFSGSVPEPTLARFQSLVTTGQLRYVLVGGGGGAGGGFAGAGGGSGSTTAIDSWVQAHCTEVPASTYGGTAATTAPTGSFGGFGGGTGTLYACASAKG